MNNYRTIIFLMMFLGISINTLAAENEDLLNELKLIKGQKYSEAKKHLIKNGWKIDVEYASTLDTEPHIPYGFKEVACGEGWQAVCSARFLRRDREVMIMLKPKQSLIVDSAWDDK